MGNLQFVSSQAAGNWKSNVAVWLVLKALLSLLLLSNVEAREGDIIMTKGKLIMRGGKKGGNLIVDTSSPKSSPMSMVMPSMMAHNYDPFSFYPMHQQHRQPPFVIHPIYLDDHSAMHQHHGNHHPQHHESVEYEQFPHHYEHQHHHPHHESEHQEIEHHEEHQPYHEEHQPYHEEHQPYHEEHQPHHEEEHQHHHEEGHYNEHSLMPMFMHRAGSMPQLYHQFAPAPPVRWTQPILVSVKPSIEQQQQDQSQAQPDEQQKTQTSTNSIAQSSTNSNQDQNALPSLLSWIKPRGFKKDLKQ